MAGKASSRAGLGDALIAELCAAVRALGGCKMPARYALHRRTPAHDLAEDRPPRAAAARLTARRRFTCIIGTEQRRKRWSADADGFNDRVESPIDSSDITRADG
jgi:hypothetical protein